jgi:hypothetical protein
MSIYRCPICNQTVDEDGLPTSTPADYSAERFAACIGHRLRAAQQKFRTSRPAKPQAVKEPRHPHNDP